MKPKTHFQNLLNPAEFWFWEEAAYIKIAAFILLSEPPNPQNANLSQTNPEIPHCSLPLNSPKTSVLIQVSGPLKPRNFSSFTITTKPQKFLTRPPPFLKKKKKKDFFFLGFAMSIPAEQHQPPPPPPISITQHAYSSHSGTGSIGPVIAVLAVITILGVVAGVIGRLCSGRRIMGYGQYDFEGWIERKCSSCIDGSVQPPPRNNANGDEGSVPISVSLENHQETKQAEQSPQTHPPATGEES